MASSSPRSPPEMRTTTIRDARGRIVHIRPIGPPDAALLVDLFQHLPPETRYRRFLASLSTIPDEVLGREANRLTTLEPQRAAALIALEQENAAAHAIGCARLIHDADEPTSAEVGIVVRDDRQNEGLGTVLLHLLLQLAQARLHVVRTNTIRNPIRLATRHTALLDTPLRKPLTVGGSP